MEFDRHTYRGKRLDDGEWVHGAYLKLNAQIMDDAYFPYPVAPATVGQCAGLKDKNSAMIFEGDVLETKEFGKDDGHGHNFADFDIFKVVWDVSGFFIKNATRMFGLQENPTLEKIGNIHDNPELLEVQHA